MRKIKQGPKNIYRINAKFIAMLISAILICTTGVTLAYLFSKTNDVENTFSPSQVTTKVVEEFDGKTKTDVKIQNTGDIRAFIRADIIVTWKAENGNVLSETPVRGEDYTMELNKEWFEKDGFYYWPSIVTAEDVTGILITEAKANNSKTVNDVTYYISIEILSSGIQADGVNENGVYAVTSAWGVSCDGTTISN